VKDFHKQFYGAVQGQIAVVGDFDEAAVVKALTDAFGNWKGGVPYQRLSSPFKEFAPTTRSLETPDKENAIFLARINVNMQDTDADFAAMTLANYIMGQSGFDSRLMARIRVKDGLSYGAGSQLSVSSTDRGAAWVAFAIAAPQNVEKVDAAFRDEIAKALKDGFTVAEVVSAKSGLLQQRLQQRAQDGSLASGMRSNLYLGRTFTNFGQKLEDQIDKLTAEQVTAAFRKHIDPAKISVFKAGDFAKVAK
jgi:zinc protease